MSSYIIIYHHISSSYIIMYHHISSCIIIYHHLIYHLYYHHIISLYIIIHHHMSSYIIIHHHHHHHHHPHHAFITIFLSERTGPSKKLQKKPTVATFQETEATTSEQHARESIRIARTTRHLVGFVGMMGYGVWKLWKKVEMTTWRWMEMG